MKCSGDPGVQQTDLQPSELVICVSDIYERISGAPLYVARYSGAKTSNPSRWVNALPIPDTPPTTKLFRSFSDY